MARFLIMTLLLMSRVLGRGSSLSFFGLPLLAWDLHHMSELGQGLSVIGALVFSS